MCLTFDMLFWSETAKPVISRRSIPWGFPGGIQHAPASHNRACGIELLASCSARSDRGGLPESPWRPSKQVKALTHFKPALNFLKLSNTGTPVPL